MNPVRAVPYLAVGPELRAFPLDREEMSVGRTPECDLFLEDHQVSRRHAVLTRRSEQTVLVDAGSSNGTFVNGMRIQGPVALHEGDRIRFATVEAVFHSSLPSAMPAPTDPKAALPPATSPASATSPSRQVPSRPSATELQGETAPPGPPPRVAPPGPPPAGKQASPPSAALERLGGAPVLLGEGEITLGRIAGNDVVLDDRLVSSHHARLVNQNGEFYIVDLNSSNGTYVNGQRISQPWELEQGDQIVLGESEFIFTRLRRLPKKRKGAPRAAGARPSAPGPKPS